MQKRLFICIAICMVLLSGSVMAEIPPIENALIIVNDGAMYDTTTNGYVETGNWSDLGGGVDNRTVRVCGDSNAKAFWKINPVPEYYDLYYWNSVIPDGDENALLDVYATTSSAGKTYIDFSKGTAQWKYAGTYYTTDNNLSLTLTGSGKGKIAASAFMLSKSTQEKFYEYMNISGNKGTEGKELIITIGSDVAKLDGEEIRLDMGSPQISNDRTIVPVRFISDVMGAEVLWKENERKVTVISNGKTVEFFIGNTTYKVQGEDKLLDSPPQIIDNRTYIPVRFLAEAIGKFVEYNNGVIMIK